MSSIHPMVWQWIRQMEDRDQASAHYAYQSLEREVLHATKPDGAEVVATLATELAEALLAVKEDAPGSSEPPKPLLSSRTRNQLTRLLSYVPTEAVVPHLRKALDDLEVREMARYALEANPSDSATSALIEALVSMGPVFRVGVVNSLAKRKGRQVISALKDAAEDPQFEVRIAAIEGLADFPEPSHDAVIARSTEAESPEERHRAHVARARLAETLRTSGHTRAAERVCEAILASGAEDPQKRAAQLTLARLAEHQSAGRAVPPPRPSITPLPDACA